MLRIRRPRGLKDRPACELSLAVDGYSRRKGLPDKLSATLRVREGLHRALA